LTDLPEVRIATKEDEEDVLRMCRRLWEENGLFSLNENKVRDTIRKCYEAKGNIVGVIGPKGSLEASTCLSISDTHYTDDWHLVELWNYVAPEYRKSRNAEALIEFGKSCSDRMGIPLFTGIITEKALAGKVRLYRRRLGNPTGAFFVHNAKFKPRLDDEPVENHTDLRKRLAAFVDAYSNQRISKDTVQGKLLPLLREVAEVLRGVEKEREFWMIGHHESKQLNGQAA
jgi:hypothetical protein